MDVRDSGLESPADYLEWDSQFFQRRIARVRGQLRDEASATALLKWSERERIDCLYYLADLDAGTSRIAEQHGFSLTDVRVTYERGLAGLPEYPAGARLARTEDVERLRQFAAGSFADSRFYADVHFDPAECDRFYATWIERSCHGYADCVLVMERNGEAAGFVTCHLRGSIGDIGLIAVAPEARGQGLGRLLVTAALRYFSESAMTRARVVTQARNIASQRLYQGCGFLIESAALWYHRWSSAADRGSE